MTVANGSGGSGGNTDQWLTGLVSQLGCSHKVWTVKKDSPDSIAFYHERTDISTVVYPQYYMGNYTDLVKDFIKDCHIDIEQQQQKAVSMLIGMSLVNPEKYIARLETPAAKSIPAEEIKDFLLSLGTDIDAL